MKWVKISDAEYLDYAKECGVSVVPEKYIRMAKKAGCKNLVEYRKYVKKHSYGEDYEVDR